MISAQPWQMRQAMLWGGTLGLSAALLFPHSGVFALVGHVSRVAVWPALWQICSVAVKGLLFGAVGGGAFGWLRGAPHYFSPIFAPQDYVEAPAWPVPLEQPAGRPNTAELNELVHRFGYEHQAFLSLYGAPQVWWSHVPEGAVVYTLVNRVALVTAAPLAAREHWPGVTQQFLAFCRAQEFACLMLPVGAEFAEVAHACGMGLLRIGESGYFKLPGWRPAGDRAKKVRAGVNQARKAGICVTAYDPHTDQQAHTRAEVAELCQAWLATREMNAMGWLLALDPFKLSAHKRYFLARNAQGGLDGLLACSPIPARRGWYLEDLLKRPGAARGVSELLVVEALKHLAAEGAELATLGTAPLAGVKPVGQFKLFAALLQLVYEYFDAFYHFKKLHRFKAKFAPSFVDPEYVALYPPHIRLRMIRAMFGVLDEEGLSGLLKGKLRRLQRETGKTI